MTGNELRRQFLAFFEGKGHKILPSASLIPKDDPTLLLTGAGMVPFKPYFLGKSVPESTRVTTCQKCIRTADIDNVGKTDRHGTFFEMLGNFSFGDYFKHEVIPWAWEFVTTILKFDPEDLWVSIYLDDDEAFEIWNKKVGVRSDRIIRLGKKDNFWEIGVGPCGPCSEIYVDRGPEHGCKSPDCNIECDCDRFMEFWNLVFIQFHKNELGEYEPLPKKSIDTGMGLERVAALLQNVNSIFDTDLLKPVRDAIAGLANIKYGENAESDVSIRVITDHIRSVTFMVSDGILPGNEGRGYVLRRLLRRAVRHGHLLGIKGMFMERIARVLISSMSEPYPELTENMNHILKVISNEEEKFNARLSEGMELLAGIIGTLKANGRTEVPGTEAFKLYDTFGFPIELTREIAEENGMTVNENGFETAMNEQRDRARAARGGNAYLDVESAVYPKLLAGISTKFVGYSDLSTDARILKIIKDGALVDSISAGDKAEIVLDRSPFYAESGGQVADTGAISTAESEAKVFGATRPVEGVIIHQVEVTRGVLREGESVNASLESERRSAIARNHTATHLLHRALKDVLGSHANQSGSLVSEDRLRFDFTNLAALSQDELDKIERIVNSKVMENLPVCIEEKSLDEARKSGATALFSEKYHDVVRVVSVSDYSVELCGGTHIASTGQIGLFKIVSESGVASGIRRIEAVTGKHALDYVKNFERLLKNLSEKLKVGVSDVEDRLDKVLASGRDLEKEIENLKARLAMGEIEQLAGSAEEVEGIKVLVSAVGSSDMDTMRAMGDKLKDMLKPAVVVLGAKSGDKLTFLAMATPDVIGKGIHSGNIVKEAASVAGGGGGGRADMAQAGGKNIEKFDEALAAAKKMVLKQLHAL